MPVKSTSQSILQQHDSTRELRFQNLGDLIVVGTSRYAAPSLIPGLIQRGHGIFVSIQHDNEVVNSLADKSIRHFTGYNTTENPFFMADFTAPRDNYHRLIATDLLPAAIEQGGFTVHCGAGQGRTGIFLASVQAIDKIIGLTKSNPELFASQDAYDQWVETELSKPPVSIDIFPDGGLYSRQAILVPPIIADIINQIRTDSDDMSVEIKEQVDYLTTVLRDGMWLKQHLEQHLEKKLDQKVEVDHAVTEVQASMETQAQAEVPAQVVKASSETQAQAEVSTHQEYDIQTIVRLSTLPDDIKEKLNEYLERKISAMPSQGYMSKLASYMHFSYSNDDKINAIKSLCNSQHALTDREKSILTAGTLGTAVKGLDLDSRKVSELSIAKTDSKPR